LSISGCYKFTKKRKDHKMFSAFCLMRFLQKNSYRQYDDIKEFIIKNGGKCMTKQEMDELLKNSISEEDFIKWLDNAF
jgi:hypothetical protein